MGCGASIQQSYIQYQGVKPTLYFLLGEPGSEKKNYCEKLIQDYRFQYLSVSDLVKLQTQKSGPYANDIKISIQKQQPLPSLMILIKMFKKAIVTLGMKQYLISGFPKSPENMEILKKMADNEIIIGDLIFFQISDQTMKQRMRAQKINQKLNEQQLKNKMEAYKKSIFPIAEYFLVQGKCIRFNTDHYQNQKIGYQKLKELLSLHNINQPKNPIFISVIGQSESKKKYCQDMCDRYGFWYLNTDEIITSICQNKTSKQYPMIESYLKQGKQIPIEFLLLEIRRIVEMKNYQGIFLLQDFPKHPTDFEKWEKVLGKHTNFQELIYIKSNKQAPKKPQPENTNIFDRSRKKITQQDYQKLISSYKNVKKYFEISMDQKQQKFLEKLKDHFSQHGFMPMQNNPYLPKIYLIIGGPGTGKSVLCEKLAKQYQQFFIYINLVQLVKKQIQRNGLYSQLIQSYITYGKNIPTDIAARFIKRQIKKHDKSKIFLLDGYPKNIINWTSWENQIGKQFFIEKVLHFDCKIEILEERLNLRAAKSPQKKYDKQIQNFKKQFENYTNETQPLLKLFKENLIKRINAEKPPDEVYIDLKDIFIKARHIKKKKPIESNNGEQNKQKITIQIKEFQLQKFQKPKYKKTHYKVQGTENNIFTPQKQQQIKQQKSPDK